MRAVRAEKDVLMRQKLERLIPRYAWLPLIALLATNMMAYYGSRLFTQGVARYDLSIPLDKCVPLCPVFIVFYILAYLQWVVGFIVIARENREVCYEVLSGEIIAKLICMAFFIALPTRMIRPEVAGDGLFERLVRLIYFTDVPINLFPSIHCLDSWFCYRGAMRLKRTPRWYAPAMLVMTLFVFASTVLVKQHVLVDIPAAILVAEAGYALSRRLKAGRVFARIEARRGRDEDA